MQRIVLAMLFISLCGRVAGAQEIRAVALDFTPLGAPRAGSTTALAPIDVNFGPYPMSIFGIENAIRRYDGTDRLHDGPLAYAVLSVRDLEARFPHDPEVPRLMLAIQRAYEHSRAAEALDFAHHIAAWLQSDYAESEFARLSKTELERFERP